MNPRALIALSCLLAAAHARPAAIASTSCSPSCSGRNFWTGYKSGTTLQYAFEHKVELSSGLSQQKSVLLQVTGRANVEVHGDCEMVLTVDVQTTKTSKSPTESGSLDAKSLPKALVDALKEPLRFSFENGRIQGLCPSAAENRASLNFKRGLLSHLHLSIDKPEQEVSVREDDVLGNCYTVYTNLGTDKFEKSKDLSSCTTNFEVYPQQGVKFEAPQSSAPWPTVVQGSLKCTIELEAESKVIKDNKCEEDRVLDNSLGDNRLGERVKVTTSLKLQQKISSVANALFEVKDRSSLNHKHKSGDKCHDSKAWFEEDIFHTGNECLEKRIPATGTASTDFKALAKKTIEELCTETTSSNLLKTSAAKYGDLIKYLRGITSQEDFNSLFDWAKTHCSSNPMLKVIVYTAIPSVGTRQSTQLILNQLKGSDGMSTDKSTANWLATGIAHISHPTPDIINDVLEFTKKAKEESMLIVSKDQPLALSAVTGRYCHLNSDCESKEIVTAVLSFFSDALGVNCSNLQSQDDQFAYDYAFVALLGIGNIGRAAGGAGSIIACAENSKLSLAHRAFALRSLRRFPDLSTSEKLRLGDLIQSKVLDSELRITAYQIVARFGSLSFWSDERVLKKLSDLMQDESEDKQLQRYVYSHLSQWIKKQKRSTDSYTVSNILREHEKVILESKLSGLQVSGYWRKQYKSSNTKSKLELESNLIYSSSSIMPRFVNFNFTVESPLSGEAINMFEFGMRMEGMEGIMEQVFNAINKDNKEQDELIRRRRQATPELTDAQKQYKQAAKKMRLDIFTRSNGLELLHNNFDETILGVVPQFMKTLDFANVLGLAQEKLSSMSFDTVSQAAGAMESTISVPTISGFPVLIKKEVYYLTNIGFKQNIEVGSDAVKLGFELQPAVAANVARTVSVDTGFDRAGVRSQTSALSSTGVKVSLEGKLNSLNDISFSFKIDPVKKSPTILDLKTDIDFVQHSGPRNVIVSPVVSPSDMAPVISKCFTVASVKLFGRRLCLDTNFERTDNPLEFVRQNPGSFNLYIDKDESFGVYEVTLKLKQDGKNFEFLAVVGDQKSPDRHAKFQLEVTRSAQSRKIVVELANPVLPIKWSSESKAKGDGFDIGVDLKFGSTDYTFKGVKSREPSGDWKLDGNFYRKDKERQQISIVTRYGSYGFLKYLPLFRFDLTATTPTNDKLTFNHLVKYAAGKFEASLLASHEKSGSVVTSIKSRFECLRMSRDVGGSTSAVLYDTEVVNKNGKSFIHTFSSKIDRKRKDGAVDTFISTMAVSHKFKHGVTKENSVLDIEVNLQLEETIKPGQLYKASGSGNIKYDADSGRKTAKLSKVRLILGESDVLDDHFETKTVLLEYATDIDGSKSEALVALQALPIQKWSLYNQCVYVTLKSTGADSRAHVFELRHTASRDARVQLDLPSIQQAARIIYASKVLLNATHRIFPISVSENQRNEVEVIAGHTGSITTYDEQTYSADTRYTVVQAGPTFTITIKINSVYDVNQARKAQLNQTLTVDMAAQKFEYKIECQRPSSYGLFRIYSKYYEYAERRQAAAEIVKYLRNARREGFKFTKFYGLLRKNVAKVEGGFDLVLPSGMKVQVSNFFDLSVSNGVLLNSTRLVTYDGQTWKYGFQIYKELEMTPARYRRFYRVSVQLNSVESLYLFETLFHRSSNPELRISVSKVSVRGPQSPDFNVSAGGQFVRRLQREGQVALNLNVTHQCRGNSFSANYRLVVDTAPWSVLNPALNTSLVVQSSTGQSLNAVYHLGFLKSQLSNRPTLKNILAVTSEFTIANSFSEIPFKSYSGVTALSNNRDEPLKFVFKKSLDGVNLIDLRATLTWQTFYIGVTFDWLRWVKEISYKAEFSREADGFIGYLSQFKLKTLTKEATWLDRGRVKVIVNSGTTQFSMVYSGTLQTTAFDNLIGSSSWKDGFTYSGLLNVLKTGEFDTNFFVNGVSGSKSENIGLVTVKYNKWPLEISSRIKVPLASIEHHGFNISAGPKSPDKGYWFRAWLASPNKQSAFEYWHTYAKTQKYELTGQATFTSDHLFNLKSDKIYSAFTVKASNLFEYSVIWTLTTPFRPFQMIQWDIASNDLQQSIAVTIKANDKQEKLLSIDQNVQTKADGTKVAKGTMVIISFMPEVTGWSKFTYIGDVVSGSDYAWGVDVSLDDQKLFLFDILWLKSGGSYPHLSRLSVPTANLGFDLNGKAFVHFHLLRSGTSAKSQWDMKYKGLVDVETKVELTNGRITSGSGKAQGRTITFSSPSDGVINVQAGSGKNTITYSGNMADIVMQSMNLKFAIDGQESCCTYKKQAQQIIVAYGSCRSPNNFKLTYQISDFWNMKKTKLQMNVEHTTAPASNQVFYLLPGLSVPIETLSRFPFKYNVDLDNQKLIGKTSFESSTDSSVKGSTEYDYSRFPEAMKFKQTLKIGSGPMQTDQKFVVDYDVTTKTVNIKIEQGSFFKLIITNREAAIEIYRTFIGGVALKTDEGKDILQIKWELAPITTSAQPCVLRLWKREISNGKKLALEFEEHSGKKLAIISDVTDIEYTPAEYKINVLTTISSTLFAKLRSATSLMKFSLIPDPVKAQYTMNYRESFTADGVLVYDLQSITKGPSRSFPTTVSSTVKGYIEAEFNYNFNPEYNADSYLLWSLNKFGESRDSYKAEYRSKDVSNHVGKFWRDFSLEFSSPRRQIYLSESCKVLTGGTVQTELQAFLNKRNLEGFVAVFNRDFTQANVYKRSLQLTLPTRKVGYDRVLKLDGNKLTYNLTVFWDMDTTLEKKFAIQFNREKERRPSGYYYYHRLDLNAPFLKNAVSKEVLYERKDNDFALTWTHTQQSYDKVTLKVSGKKNWNSERGAYQKEFNISFVQQRGDVQADMRITLETARISNQKHPQVYTSAKFIKVVNIYTNVPSQSVNSHVRIRYVPSEEFTYACNHGATFSFRYYKGFKRSRTFLFVSNSKKEAGQLTIVRDWLVSTWQLTLDSGKGYMDPKSTLSFPIYEPTKVLVKATAGLSTNRRKIHFGVINGASSVSSQFNLWKPETVPAELDFFFVGAKLNDDNTLGYASHWRIRQQTVKSPFVFFKEVLVDPWAKVKSLPFGSDTINRILKPVAQSKSDNINTDAVLDLLTSISSNDIDSLKRWAEKAKENNEFLSNTIGTYLTYGFYIVRSGIETFFSSVKNLPYSFALPSDFGILAGISRLSDATTEALGRIQVAEIWRTSLTMIKYGSELVGQYFSAYIDRLDSGIRSRISSLTGGAGTSILDMVYDSIASVYPIRWASEKFSTIVSISIESLYIADYELASQVGVALQPFFISTLAEIPKVYDFLDNLFYEINQWCVYITSAVQAFTRSKADQLQNNIPGQSVFSRKLMTSLGLFLLGDYSGAIRHYFNTEANVVRVWRVTCDETCSSLGSFAAINGTLYLPFETSSIYKLPIYSDQSDQIRSPYSMSSIRKRVQYGRNWIGESSSEKGLGGVVRKLVSPEHRTAEATGRYIRTFDGKELRNLSPCRYLLANDFQNGDFSVYQTYKWDGRKTVRGDLLVRFFKVKASISNRNELKLDDVATTLPVSRTFDEQSVEASNTRDSVTIGFHGELRNAVTVKCWLSRDSCTIRVNPLYHGRLNGALGSNDGNSANDLHANSESEHMRLWVTDSCVQSS